MRGLRLGLSLVGGVAYRPVPSGFGGTVPFGFRARRVPATRTFTTNITLLNPLSSATAATTIYVDKATGSDANAGTNSAQPKASIKSALTATNSASSALILVKGGRYTSVDGWAGVSPTCQNLAVASWDGQPVYSSSEQTGTWTSVDGTTYSTTIAGIGTYVKVWDANNPTTDGDYGLLTLAASQAACQSTANSYFVSTTTVYVHTFDGRAPDANLHVLDNGANGGTNGQYLQPTGAIYLENIHFEGGIGAFWVQNTAAEGTPNSLLTGGVVKAKNCSFKYSSAEAFRVQGAFNSLLVDCIAAHSGGDGLAYAHYTNSNPGGNGIEIGCIGRYCGYDSSGANNGSTCHDGWWMIRVNGDYHHNQDRNVHDVGSGGSWNLGCNSRSDQNSGSGLNANWQCGTAGTATTMWLDCCDSSGSPNDLNVDSAAAIHCNELVGDSTATGTGVIDFYDPDHDPVPAAHPLASLFGAGDSGCLYDIRDGAQLYTANGVTSTNTIGGAVGLAIDRSGKGNHVLNRTMSENPLLEKDGNGKYYLQFDGSTQRLKALFTMSQPYTRISLFKLRTYAAGKYILGGGTGDNAVLYQHNSPQLAIYDGAAACDTNQTTNTLITTTEIHNGASSSLSVNGGTATTGNPGTGGATGIVLASSGPSQQPSAIDFYATIFISRVLSASEISQVLANFS